MNVNPSPRDLLNHVLAVSFTSLTDDVIITNVTGREQRKRSIIDINVLVRAYLSSFIYAIEDDKNEQIQKTLDIVYEATRLAQTLT